MTAHRCPERKKDLSRPVCLLRHTGARLHRTAECDPAGCEVAAALDRGAVDLERLTSPAPKRQPRDRRKPCAACGRTMVLPAHGLCGRDYNFYRDGALVLFGGQWRARTKRAATATGLPLLDGGME